MTTTSEHGHGLHTRAGRAVPRQDGHWAVQVRGLTKRFGTRTAVDSVDLLVPRGCAFGYLGPNGAGKTTLIRVLLGLTRADSGTMSLLGVPVPAQHGRALARVGAIVDEPRFHGHLTGRENLKILAAARGPDAAKQIGPALDRAGMDEVERTCDQVAIVDHGKVILQGPIGELIGGAGVAVEVQCPDPPAAARALGQLAIASRVAVSESGLTVTLTEGAAREKAAEINRRLVEDGIPVYGLHQTHTSLEDWFLSVTTRLGGKQ